MRNAYTITSGYIKCGDKTCEILFALVFLNEGVYSVETFFKDNNFYEQTKNELFYTLFGKTEKRYDFEGYGLFCTQFEYSNHKATFICQKFIKLINNKNMHGEDERSADETKKEEQIYFTEIEGLKMHFGNHTSFEKYRYTGKVNEFLNFEFDHQGSMLMINHPAFIGNHYYITFTKNPPNDNVLIDFTYHEGYSRFNYEIYKIIKKELISILSFINGGDVFIRRELTGNFHSTKGDNEFDSQIVFLYSRKTFKEHHCDDYLPIDKYHSYTDSIIPNLLGFCFDKFFHLNEELDFDSLIFSLNNATKTAGLDEKYFILITALERISSNYAKSKNKGKQTLIDKAIFQNVKTRLFESLNEFKPDIDKDNKSAWEIFKSRIGSLNNRNEADTNQKLYEFLQYAKIPINDEVKKLIEKERHSAVHEGIIGTTEGEKIYNYWKLDHILRDCILNLIGYDRYRKPKVDYLKIKLSKDQEKYIL